MWPAGFWIASATLVQLFKAVDVARAQIGQRPLSISQLRSHAGEPGANEQEAIGVISFRDDDRLLQITAGGG